VTESNEVAELVAAVNAELTDPKRNHLVEGSADEPGRFELYHAGLSVCSQKVRAVLAEKGASYTSHELSILNSKGIYSDELTPAENYSPDNQTRPCSMLCLRSTDNFRLTSRRNNIGVYRYKYGGVRHG
jgi:hypothetical protein